ncbi:hypothetical protein KDK_35090 [Dictyobacter kobayashii]|uniref:Uncharacterized protein n=1 Tax=Dictyobacter kobayashii TaxID=2014872 RepID=A0A402AKX8_9CHLR|nr:hypothetical protein KDK_35090 [Dictyobacter kobayashii]
MMMGMFFVVIPVIVVGIIIRLVMNTNVISIAVIISSSHRNMNVDRSDPVC